MQIKSQNTATKSENNEIKLRRPPGLHCAQTQVQKPLLFETMALSVTIKRRDEGGNDIHCRRNEIKRRIIAFLVIFDEVTSIEEGLF